MSFTYDVTTTRGQMRLLLGDTDPNNAKFTDEELDACYNITSLQLQGPQNSIPHGAPSDVLFYACATAMDAFASRVASSKDGRSIKIGDYQISGTAQVQKLQDIAQRFRDAVDNMPAWGIVEDNVSTMNEMLIIRNWVLRTEV